jgi:FkbM family methyltransferase
VIRNESHALFYAKSSIQKGEYYSVSTSIFVMLEIDNDVTSPFGTYSLNPSQKVVLSVARLPCLCRGWARPTWTRILDRLRPGVIDYRDKEVAFRLYPTTNLTENGLLLNKTYNLAEIDYLMAGLGPDSVFVDIGANIGLYSIRIAKAIGCFGGKVIAIEPNPPTLERLRFNINANKLDNVSVHEVAVGDYCGFANLAVNKENLAIVNTVRDDETGKISVVPLEDILDKEGVSRIDALKIDIEGYEYRALQPFFTRCSKKMWPKRISIEHLEIEHLGDKSDIETLLVEIGYNFMGKTRSNAFYSLGD